MQSNTIQLPEIGFLRLPQIIGDPKTDPPTPAIFPISKSSWWAGVRSGKYPRAYKLSANTTVWLAQDIKELIDEVINQEH